MKKQNLKNKSKDILIILFLWLLTISIAYLVYLKIKLFYHA
jgi:hypothetical protein